MTFAGMDIADMSRLPLKRLAAVFRPFAAGTAKGRQRRAEDHPEQAIVTRRIAEDLEARLAVLLDLGLGYLALDRSTPTLSPGELQRLRLATQVRSNLFGVVYVLDEPSAGLHPADTEALLRALDRLKASGNSLFVVEHDLDVIRHADWIVDVGPDAGEHGGEILYSGPPEGLARVAASHTRRYLFAKPPVDRRVPRTPQGWLRLTGVTRNNLENLDVEFPLCVFTTVTGVSGSGKSSLVSQALVELVASHLGHEIAAEEDDGENLERRAPAPLGGRIAGGMEHIKRLVRVDQKPIGRTPRSNLATYTGLFDHVRKLFAATKAARSRRYDAGRFSFNVAKGRCETCEGEGFVMVELLFLPSVYAPCPACHGARYNAKTLEIQYRGQEHRRSARHDRRRGVGVLRGRAAGAAHARRAAGGRRRLPAARPAGDRAVRRRGAADQARHRAAARAARRCALCPGRAHDRAASFGCRETAGAARQPRRRRQHRHRRRARDARGPEQRLGDRRRAQAPETRAGA